MLREFNSLLAHQTKIYLMKFEPFMPVVDTVNQVRRIEDKVKDLTKLQEIENAVRKYLGLPPVKVWDLK